MKSLRFTSGPSPLYLLSRWVVTNNHRYQPVQVIQVHVSNTCTYGLCLRNWAIRTFRAEYPLLFRCWYKVKLVERVIKREQEVESLSRPRAEFIYFIPFTWGDSSCIRSACLSLLASGKSSTRSLPLTPNWPQIVLTCTFHCVVAWIKGLSLM